MSTIRGGFRRWWCVLPLLWVLTGSGCHTVPRRHGPPATAGQDVAPRELSKAVLPAYRIEPPDMLWIEAVNVVPRPPYYLKPGDELAVQVQGLPSRLRTGDVLAVQARGAPSDMPIDGDYEVGPGGLINLAPPYGSVDVLGLTVEDARRAIDEHLRTKGLVEPLVTASLAQAAGAPITGPYRVEQGGVIGLGLPYGTVRVIDMTAEEAEKAIEDHLRRFFERPTVSVTLRETVPKQQIQGEHMVQPDGTVRLGIYGSVSVVGRTLDEAKLAIEQHLSQFLEDPEIAVDVYGFNSRKYYVIMGGAGLGDSFYAFPHTGNETVLDAIVQVGGLEQVSSKRIWVARPTPNTKQVQVLPVNYEEITAEGGVRTNYQIFPGDRVYIAEDKLVAFDTALGKLIAPLERLMGIALLGAETATRFSGKVLRGGGNPRGSQF